MGRWQDDVRKRLERAALDLYVENGYAATTVGGIAERAGVTSRTYFRYFPDKREVLFEGAAVLQDAVVLGVGDAPPSAPPLQAALRGIEGADRVFRPREFVRRRAAVIATSDELREREAMKLAALGAAVSEALVRRGADPADAPLAAAAGIAVFGEAFAGWLAQDEVAFPVLVREAAARLADLVVPPGPVPT